MIRSWMQHDRQKMKEIYVGVRALNMANRVRFQSETRDRNDRIAKGVG
jgi:hypothetical protein